MVNSDWEYLRSNWNFAVDFEHSQHTNIRLNDVWNIPGLMKWIQTKWLFQNIYSQFDLTHTKVPYQTYLRDCVFHLKWLQARPLPTCLIQCCWFKMHKFQSSFHLAHQTSPFIWNNCNLLWNGDLFDIWLKDIHLFWKKLKLCQHRFNLRFQLSRTVYFASDLFLISD